MSDRSANNWDRLGEAFAGLETMTPEQRESRLAEIAEDDRELAGELRELLAEHDADRPLEIERLFSGGESKAQGGSIGRQIGPYRIIEVLGRGGMGEVFLAERIDGAFEQRVALKLVRAAIDNPHARARFLAERQILARL